MHTVELTVNGQVRSLQVASTDRLADALRTRCGLTGTNQGCDTAQCGACTVLVNGLAIKSCNVLAVQVAGEHITTVEGLAQAAHLHPMQAAFAAHEALQCGYCTPGMILRAVSMYAENTPLEASAIRTALAGNLCRCTGYEPIVSAILAGLTAMHSTASTRAE